VLDADTTLIQWSLDVTFEQPIERSTITTLPFQFGRGYCAMLAFNRMILDANSTVFTTTSKSSLTSESIVPLTRIHAPFANCVGWFELADATIGTRTILFAKQGMVAWTCFQGIVGFLVANFRWSGLLEHASFLVAKKFITGFGVASKPGTTGTAFFSIPGGHGSKGQGGKCGKNEKLHDCMYVVGKDCWRM
jgi:hypothetical protein